ncbi:MAG: hypothetical protein H0X62_05865 [Bacteroidetes bacterium]|nr:hypothetical protein [Bacteroidota bacterium]
MKKLNNILSEKELKEYFNKDTSPERLDAIKQKASQDPFFLEAIEGFEAFPAEVENLSAARNYMQKKLFRNKFNYAYLGAIPVLAILAYLLIGHLDIKQPEVEFPIVEESIMPNQEEQDSLEPTAETEIELQSDQPENMDNATIIAIKKTEMIASKDKEMLHLKAIERIIPPTTLPVAEFEVKKAIRPKKYNFQVTYVHDLKVADYSSRRTNPAFNSNGVEARFGNSDEITADGGKKEIAYNHFLSETMAQFVAGDYKTAISNFEVIQKHFPNDVNAWFYSGLAHYKLGSPTKAIGNFEKAEDYFINIFDEEAQWYRALSLEQAGEKEALSTLLEKIITRESFYAEKAKQKLESLK